MKILVFILLSLALLFEASLTTIPLIFLILLCLTALFQKEWIFIYAFIFGILLDVLSFRAIGISSGFFLTFLFLVILYKSRFEIATSQFVFISSLVGSLAFLLLTGYTSSLILEVLVSGFLGLIIFKILQRKEKQV